MLCARRHENVRAVPRACEREYVCVRFHVCGCPCLHARICVCVGVRVRTFQASPVDEFHGPVEFCEQRVRACSGVGQIGEHVEPMAVQCLFLESMTTSISELKFR